MKNQNETVDQLKSYLTRQLEAYERKDWATYNKLENIILELEKNL